mgnify:CR=1 FL=1
MLLNAFFEALQNDLLLLLGRQVFAVFSADLRLTRWINLINFTDWLCEWYVVILVCLTSEHLLASLLFGLRSLPFMLATCCSCLLLISINRITLALHSWHQILRTNYPCLCLFISLNYIATSETRANGASNKTSYSSKTSAYLIQFAMTRRLWWFLHLISNVLPIISSKMIITSLIVSLRVSLNLVTTILLTITRILLSNMKILCIFKRILVLT